jgi:hypothetical protein
MLIGSDGCSCDQAVCGRSAGGGMSGWRCACGHRTNLIERRLIDPEPEAAGAMFDIKHGLALVAAAVEAVASATAPAVFARVALLWPFKHLSEENIVAFQ